MAKRFQQKVIEDARKAGSLYPTNIRKELKILSDFLGDYFFVLDFGKLLKVNPTTITPTRHGQSCPHYVSVQTILVYYETFKSHDTPPLSALFGIKPPNYRTLQNDFQVGGPNCLPKLLFTLSPFFFIEKYLKIKPRTKLQNIRLLLNPIKTFCFNVKTVLSSLVPFTSPSRFFSYDL